MALTININSDGYNVSNAMNLAYVSTTTSGVFKFKCLLEVTYATDQANTKTISFTQSKLTANNFLFDLSEIYKTIVTPMTTASGLADADGTTIPSQKWSIHHLPYDNTGATRLFSAGIQATNSPNSGFRGNANVLTLKFYEFYSTTATGVPVKQTSTEVEKTIYLMYGRGEADEKVVLDFSPYKAVNSTSSFLNSNYNRISTTQVNVDIGKNDYHTLSFFNQSTINTLSAPDHIFIAYYQQDGTTLGFTKADNILQTGGQAPDPTNEDEFFLLTCGVGLSNLQNIDLSESPYSGTLPDFVTGGRDAIAYFEIKLRNTFNQPITSVYRFNIKEYCPRYEQNRISWLNKFGVWEYMTLNKAVEENLEIERQTITKPLLSQTIDLTAYLGAEYLNSIYPQNVAKQGEMISQIYAKEKLKLFTDNLTEDFQVEMIKDLMMSEQVHLLDGDNAVALILENSNMKLKAEKETGLFQYELTFRYANPKYKL